MLLESANPYLIQDANDYLYAVSFINSMDDSSDKYFKLLADLDLSNSDSIGAIGSEAHPFMGHFDGNGHAITGLNAKDGSMFGVVKGGSVTNLTLLDMTCNEVDQCSPLVKELTDNNGNRGSISNCYVGGNITVKLKFVDLWTVAPLSGLCGTCRGGQISDSYFKGKFNVSCYDAYCNFAGLCSTIEKGTVNSKISDCYSIFNISVDDENLLKHVFGIVNDLDTGTLSDDIAELNNVYFMYDGENLQVVHNGTKASSYADIKVGSPFIDGIFNPVLPGTKSYKLTNGKGLDAILEDGEGTGDLANVIFHYVPADGEDYENDPYLWQHPNVAVYNADDDAEYLINCNLDNAKALQLNMDIAKSQTIKANMHYPLSIYHNYTDRPLTKLLCLPVTVQRDALPEGSKLKIVGKKALNADDKTFISTMVECDSVPAGVPFLVEIPADKTIYDKNAATYDLVLRGKVAPEPVYTISVGDINMETELKGTYVGFTKKVTSDTYKKYREYCGVNDDGSYEITHEASTVSPFQAYAEVESPKEYTRYYYLIDNLLLDEESNDVTAMLNTYNGKTTGVVLKRTMNSSVWNTVCLPFDLSAAEISQAFGENTKVEKLARVEKAADGSAMLRFEAVTTGMEAGKTYLVKPAKSGTLYNFANKEIKNELSSEAADSYYNTYFKGTFAPMMLQGTAEQTADGYSYNYFIQSNNLYYLPEGEAVPLKGFRGWILIASNSLFGDGSATAARLIHYDGSTTGVSAIEYGKTADGTRIYNLQGIETDDTAAPGVYIKKGKKYVKK